MVLGRVSDTLPPTLHILNTYPCSLCLLSSFGVVPGSCSSAAPRSDSVYTGAHAIVHKSTSKKCLENLQVGVQASDWGCSHRPVVWPHVQTLAGGPGLMFEYISCFPNFVIFFNFHLFVLFYFALKVLPGPPLFSLTIQLRSPSPRPVTFVTGQRLLK